MSLGQVPKSVPADEKVVSSSVSYKTSSGIDLTEFRAYVSIDIFDVFRGDVYVVKRSG